MEKVAELLHVAVVADGSNWDDRGEHRPGLQAARDRKVRSPLAECGLTKAEIRGLARHWDLPAWDKPATPCLSSRIAYGEAVTPERLAMIDHAERFLRSQGFQPLRVRYHKGDMARIEVPAEALARFTDADFRRKVVEQFRAAGFKYVSLDLEGFRSGSMNAVLPAESLQILRPLQPNLKGYRQQNDGRNRPPAHSPPEPRRFTLPPFLMMALLADSGVSRFGRRFLCGG